ncbi:MAG: T9SS type A sorting domain-containing protein, partial [candidate division WOR-3 bacterium]
GMITVDVPAPEYTIQERQFVVEKCAFINEIGAPRIPCRIVTIALPPGAVVTNVSFFGVRQKIGIADILPTAPPVALTDKGSSDPLQQFYNVQSQNIYMTDQEYPFLYGKMLSSGGMRKYSLVTVACFHFSYHPPTQTISVAPRITVTVEYREPHPPSERAQLWSQLRDDITFDAAARKIIFNWEDAISWYSTDTPRQAQGYYIIIPDALQNSVNSLVTWRQNQGYDVQLITIEYIASNITGDDLPQKIRNYLRQNMTDINYALLVGFSSDIPWRQMVPFNNDPYSPWNHPDYSPIPSDLYYAELTDHDTLSWNSDQDAYYGEVFNENFLLVGEDNPDYHADIHLGRIPFSDQGIIEDICEKTIAFDCNTDTDYKSSSLLAGALYYYANENNTGNARMDGADYCEQLMIDSILDRANAVSLYEKEGLRPCTLSCTDTLRRTNMIAYWQNKGVMYECHHGNVDVYARKLWAWDDGDSIPETNEITWPTSLYSGDVYQLDNDHPATCFLRSCLCGKPEATGLGASLLYRGASSVISSSRISWATGADYGGIPYHFYKWLMRDTTVSNGVIGNAYDMARTDFMDITSFWLPAYHYNLFGDPALRQYGRLTGVQDALTPQVTRHFNVYPNPTPGHITVHMPLAAGDNQQLYIYDECGRLVRNITVSYDNGRPLSIDLDVPCGVYFAVVKSAASAFCKKIVILQ